MTCRIACDAPRPVLRQSGEQSDPIALCETIDATIDFIDEAIAKFCAGHRWSADE